MDQDPDPDPVPDSPNLFSDAETLWLNQLVTFISRQVFPVLSDSASSDGSAPPTGVSVLSRRLLDILRRKSSILPISYRPISVADLISQQHLPCVSNFSWSTNQRRSWVREAELSVSGGRALPQVYLLLIGCLRKGRDHALILTDASGSISCQCVCPSPWWLDRPVLLPHWNYIPHDPLGRDQGWVELIGSPEPLWPEDPGMGAELNSAVGVKEAAAFLLNRRRGQRVSVRGQVSSVCPLMEVGGATFFIFSLTDGSDVLPVIVKDQCRWWWAERLRVGGAVCVTALRVCVMRGWRGNNILCVSERSELHTEDTFHQDTPPPAHHRDNNPKQEEDEGEELLRVQSGVRVKESRIISYQGTVTDVVSEGAGLYVIDRKVGLCLAYQPPLKRKLRAGDQVELHHVHFLLRPCPDFPPSMLCTCLRSSLTVTAFSRVGGASADSASTCPGDGVLRRLLVEKNVGVAEYLWACHVTKQLSVSLLPGGLSHQCVCLLSWKLLESVWKQRRPRRRDIYSEMIDHPHTCPLSQYSVDPTPPQYCSLSQLSVSLQTDSWTSVSLQSLLPPGGSSLTQTDLNSVLSWSCKTTANDCRGEEPNTDRSYKTRPSHVQEVCHQGGGVRPRPLLLVGMLELPQEVCSSFGHTLQLRDRGGVISCVVTETNPEDRVQTAVFNSAWIGCLVCVQFFSTVTERFLQSQFPSSLNLNQERYIINKYCRVYLQFSLDQVVVLSPSVAMVTHLRQQGAEPAADVSGGQRSTAKKRRVEAPKPCPCVSMVIWLEHKEGVAWKNNGAEREEEAGLALGFSVRAAVIGPVVSWGRDPKNEPVTEKEACPRGACPREVDKSLLKRFIKSEVLSGITPLQLVKLDSTEKTARVQLRNVDIGLGAETVLKVQLLFSAAAVRWFPVLQPGRFYRLVAMDTQDSSVLIGCQACEQKGVGLDIDSTLQVRCNWRFHTVTRPQHLLSQPCSSAPVLSVTDVLDSRTPDLVCFQALVCDRINLNHNTRVRLTVCDSSGRSLQVYLDLSHASYPLGLLPGNSLLLHCVQRRVSRNGNVYVSVVPVSSVTVVTLLGPSVQMPAAPIMHLGLWADSGCGVGVVKGHVVCFLLVQLQWSCSLCGCVFTQSCSSTQCTSSSAVFQSKAKVVFEDGTAECHIIFFNPLVQTLLRLADSQWEGLKRALRVKGHIRLYSQGRSLVSDSDSAPLVSFLSYICSSAITCRPLHLTCRKTSGQGCEELRRFNRGDRDFMTRMTPPLLLTCTHLYSD